MLHRIYVVVPAVALVAALLFLSKPAVSADQPSRPLAERGDYLTTMFGCKDCHTPGFFYGASDKTRELSGSEVGWSGPWGVTYAPNLTPDPETGLGRWTDEQLITTLRTGIRPDKSVLRPPMPWQNYAQMTDDDMRAIVAYLRSIPAVKHAEPASLPPGGKPSGSFFTLPPPPAWDAPKKALGK